MCRRFLVWRKPKFGIMRKWTFLTVHDVITLELINYYSGDRCSYFPFLRNNFWINLIKLELTNSINYLYSNCYCYLVVPFLRLVGEQFSQISGNCLLIDEIKLDSFELYWNWLNSKSPWIWTCSNRPFAWLSLNYEYN